MLYLLGSRFSDSIFDIQYIIVAVVRSEGIKFKKFKCHVFKTTLYDANNKNVLPNTLGDTPVARKTGSVQTRSYLRNSIPCSRIVGGMADSVSVIVPF